VSFDNKRVAMCLRRRRVDIANFSTREGPRGSGESTVEHTVYSKDSGQGRELRVCIVR
jgi:hypothetical protein